MDLRFLSYFVAVYEKESISGAARHCFISQPSISHAIKQLEKELAVQLFNRYSRGVVATGDGRKLYPLAKKLLNDANSVKQQFGAAQGAVPFRLGLCRALGVERICNLIQQFSQNINHLELTLVDHNDSHDGRIISSSQRHRNESFTPIWHDRYVLAVPRGHPLSVEARVQLSTLDQLPFISRQSCEGQSQLFYALEQQGITVNIRAKIQTVEYALGLVSAGVGVALVPNLPGVMGRSDLCFIEISEQSITRTIGLAYSGQIAPSYALNQLIKICEQARNLVPVV